MAEEFEPEDVIELEAVPAPEEKGPYAAITNGGISVISDKVAFKLAKKNLSPSLVRDIQEGCPASWLAGSFILPDLIQEEPDNPATRGSLFHRVMELAFELEPEARTKKAIYDMIPVVLEEDDFAFFKGNDDAMAWLEDAIEGYYEMGGNPKKVNVAMYQRKEDEEAKLGLEIFVKGKLGETERDTLGFIDRLAQDRNVEDGVIIEDWKTGAKAKEWNPKTKGTEGLAEARQQVIYAMLLRQSGVNVTGARLIYPVARKVVTVNVNDDKFNERVISDIEGADKALSTMIENNVFEYRPSILCSWCKLNNICPAAQNATFPKAIEARKKLPKLEDLAEGFDFA